MIHRSKCNRRTFLYSAAAGGSAWAVSRLARNGWAMDSAGGELSGLLEPIRAKHEVPALAAAFVHDGKLIEQGTIGKRIKDGSESVEMGDRFHLGSCTKAMTATLVGALVEAEVLSWETTIGSALPELVGRIRPEFETVTMSDLLAHRGGIPGKASPRKYEALQRTYRSFRGSMHEQRLELTRRTLSGPPVSEPGSRFSYSNLGYIIAGAMLEELTGELWEDLIRERLFCPLGMATAGFGAPGSAEKIDQPRGHTATACEPIPPGLLADNAPLLGPAGTVCSSMADWAKFVALHLRGARGESGLLLQPETMAAIQRDRKGQGYALGWAVTHRDWADGNALTHAGSNTLWHAVAWIAPNRNAAFLAATNWGAKTGFEAIDESVAAMIQHYL